MREAEIHASIASLHHSVSKLRQDALDAEHEFSSELEAVPAAHRESARNLVHYLALRRTDIRALQVELSTFGLSSLGRLEAHVLAGIEAVLFALGRMTDEPLPPRLSWPDPRAFHDGDEALFRHTNRLLGPAESERGVRIMVTMPTEAATDYALVRRLVQSGMNVMRINSAHDDPDAWQKMVEHARRAEAELHRSCRVLFDLCGPKLRTGNVEAGPPAVRAAPAEGAPIGASGPKAPFVRLSSGDRLRLTRVGAPRHAADDLPEISCPLAAIFDDVRVGDPISFDDGKFWGTVQAIMPDGLEILIDRAPPRGAKLRADKGINLPQTPLSAPALSPEDVENLDFAAQRVDMVGLSFVREPRDLLELQSALEERTAREIGVILKIETRRAFENLPRLLLAGLRKPPLGVMVARGDLGVEVGFERLAEVQEQILWLCEAAHVPVIWATQVLERLAKKGMPSRAEVTDAAMSGRAECVMLNKGPFVVDAVEFLDHVLLQMREHHHKKTPMLRRLKVSEGRYRRDESPAAG